MNKRLTMVIGVIVGLNLILVDWIILKSASSISNVTVEYSIKIIEAAVMTLNLTFVISFWVVERKQKRIDYTLKVQDYWFREILLKKYLDAITMIFEESVRNIEEVHGCKENYCALKPIYSEIKHYINDVRDGFCVLLEAIDIELAQRILQKLQDYEDFITLHMFYLAKGDITKEELIYLIQKQEADFYKELYKYDSHSMG